MKSSLNLFEGQVIAQKYEIVSLLGSGWEGEVYLTREKGTGIERTAKFFYPKRNLKNKCALTYAKKLHKLRNSPNIIQYHNQEVVEIAGDNVTALISEYVEGEQLSEFVAKQKGKRLPLYMALHLFYHITLGLEKIHDANEYHGDLHSDNIMVKQSGMGFELKFLDFYNWGASFSEMRKADIVDLVRLLYEIIGGQKYYSKQPQFVKDIICGGKTSLVTRRYRSVSDVRRFLENIDWD